MSIGCQGAVRLTDLRMNWSVSIGLWLRRLRVRAPRPPQLPKEQSQETPDHPKRDGLLATQTGARSGSAGGGLSRRSRTRRRNWAFAATSSARDRAHGPTGWLVGCRYLPGGARSGDVPAANAAGCLHPSRLRGSARSTARPAADPAVTAASLGGWGKIETGQFGAMVPLPTLVCPWSSR